jgi:hypothetical protein
LPIMFVTCANISRLRQSYWRLGNYPVMRLARLSKGSLK